MFCTLDNRPAWEPSGKLLDIRRPRGVHDDGRIAVIKHNIRLLLGSQCLLVPSRCLNLDFA